MLTQSPRLRCKLPGDMRRTAGTAAILLNAPENHPLHRVLAEARTIQRSFRASVAREPVCFRTISSVALGRGRISVEQIAFAPRLNYRVQSKQ